MDAEAPTDVVLIHGLWMNPRSWEGWAARYALDWAVRNARRS